jgi:hypothetical protein
VVVVVWVWQAGSKSGVQLRKTLKTRTIKPVVAIVAIV